MTPEEVQKALKVAKTKIEFDLTTFGIIDNDGVECAAGYKETFDPLTGEWQGSETFLPRPTAEMRQGGELRIYLETMIMVNRVQGAESRIWAVIITPDLAFLAFGEGLIVDNLIQMVDGYFTGKIKALCQEWKLVIQDINGPLEDSNDMAIIDENFQIVECLLPDSE